MSWRNKSDAEKSEILLDAITSLTIGGGIVFLFFLTVAALLFAPWPIKVAAAFIVVLEGLAVASLWYGTRPSR